MDIRTSIPTPFGFKDMTDIHVGDTVFDMNGKVTTVIYESPVQLGNECFEVTFDDNTTVIAGAEHLWWVTTKLRRKNGYYDLVAKTTRQLIAEGLIYSGEKNFRVPVAFPLDLPHAELNNDPYLLGLWLGDGDSAGPRLTSVDREILDHNLVDHDNMRQQRSPVGTVNREVVYRPKIKIDLNADNLRNNKHIPFNYLRASYSQRHALLEGLMDTDGWAEYKRPCTIALSDYRLARGVYQLVATLGYKPRWHMMKISTHGKQSYRIAFTPDQPVFRLSRKRVVQLITTSLVHAYRAIKSITPVPSVATKCIQVASETSSYLITDALIPTHNTKTGAETVRKYVESKRAHHIALVGPTAADVRDVMVGLDPDSSGLLQVCPPWNRPTYEPSKRRVVWPNGTVATLYSGEEPERLRGPQHDMAWADEPASWQNLEDCWDNLMFGLRRGESKVIVTGTPKPHPWVINMTKDPDVILTRGTTYDNPFLSQVARDRYRKRYEGTRLGRQELYGDILDDVPGALWTYGMFEKMRIRSLDDVPSLSRIVIPLDVAVTSKNKSAQTGITAVGVGKCYCNGGQLPEMHGFVLGDYSDRLSPDDVLKTALVAYKVHHGDRIIGEVNNGGDWIESLLRTHDEHVPYTAVRATRGKIVRAEPISALYEQGKVHHVGNLTPLEDQMVTFVSGDVAGLKDRVDSVVWGFTELYKLMTGTVYSGSAVENMNIDKPVLAGLMGRKQW